jgi:hypothetical protein
MADTAAPMKPSQMAAAGLIKMAAAGLIKIAAPGAPKAPPAQPKAQAQMPRADAPKPPQKATLAPTEPAKAEPKPTTPIEISERLARAATREQRLFQEQQRVKAQTAKLAADRAALDAERQQRAKDFQLLDMARTKAKEDPYGVMEAMGADFRKLADQALKRPPPKTAEQLALDEMRAEQAELKKRLAQQDEESQKNKQKTDADIQVTRFKREVRAAITADSHKHVMAKAEIQGVSVPDLLLAELEQINKAGKIDALANVSYRTMLDRLEKSLQAEAQRWSRINKPVEAEDVAPVEAPKPKRRQTLSHERARASAAPAAPANETLEQRKKRIMMKTFGGMGGHGFGSA